MRIGIDARLLNETGVGRYIRNLIEQLKELDKENQYIVYLSENTFSSFVLPNNRWEKRLATPHWHTLWEQIAMPFLFLKDNLDLLHVPYFNIPIFYPKKYIATIHDLTILHFPTGKASLLFPILYWLKFLAFKLILAIGLKRSAGIITPSETTKQEIIEHFNISGEKIKVTYEGVDAKISRILSCHSCESRNLKMPDQVRHDKKPKNPYFLYVGNAYPHKNLEILIDAFGDFLEKNKGKNRYVLLLVGKNDVFYTRLQAYVKEKNLNQSVLFNGSADDKTLQELYGGAEAFVFPSLMEGFGLPALEAISLGTPVICSDIPIFHEILGDLPYYINPKDRYSISLSFFSIDAIQNAFAERKKERMALMKQYSWKQLGAETLNYYQSSSLSSHT